MLTKINKLLKSCDLWEITEDHLNSDAVHVVYTSGDSVVGFIWAGLMANGKIAYIDYFAVDKQHRSKDIGRSLSKDIIALCRKRGVKEIMAAITHDEYHDMVGKLALETAIGARPKFYTFLHSYTEKMEQDLKSVGIDLNG